MERGPRVAFGREGGFTLIELVVTVALLFMIAGSAYESLAQHPAQVRTSAVTFAGLIADARSLAAVTAGPDSAGGASIGVVRDGDTYVATVYTYRPVLGAGRQPEPQRNLPPLRTPVAIELGGGTDVTPPPFAIFIGASGHASAKAGFRIGATAALAAEPVCRSELGIVIVFSDGKSVGRHSLSCEMAQLDLDDAALRPAATPLPRRVPNEPRASR